MQKEVCVAGGGAAGLRQISLHPISLWHPSAHLLSPSILDDNSVLICIPKTLSDKRLPSRCERLENIDNYWQNPKAWATFHLEYCIYSTVLFSYLLLSSFLRGHVIDWEIWLPLRRLMSRVGEVCSVCLLRKWLRFGREVMLLLLVCAHFPMTQTLIKIIITVAPCMALQWGLCRLRPSLCKPCVISYSAYRQILWLQW